MDITDIRIIFAKGSEWPLLAFCNANIVDGVDEFAVYNFKIIETEKKLFVEMPKRHFTGDCQSCLKKNSLRADFCNWCGVYLDDRFHQKNHKNFCRDIFHPTKPLSRIKIEEAILSAYREEKFSQK